MTDTSYGAGPGGTADDHREALRALEQIDSEIGGMGGGAAADALDRNQLCEQYRRIKPLLETAIRLVQAIPVYGPRIAAAIRFLMTIADQVCPG